MRSHFQVVFAITVGLLISFSLIADCTSREFVYFIGRGYGTRGVPYPSGSNADIVRFETIPFATLPVYWYDCPGTMDVEQPPHPQLVIPSEYVGSYSHLHLLHSLAHATDVPQGVIAGSLVVHYKDGSESLLTLVTGVNSAEWAYDREDNQNCLLHDKVTPAVSRVAYDDQGQSFLAHSFCSSIELDTDKEVVSIDFRLSEEACKLRPFCGEDWLWSWFRVTIKAITLEY